MKKKHINIFTNETDLSLETQTILAKKLVDRGYTVTEEYSGDKTELIICIGGDGALLKAVHSCSFPECPIIGIPGTSDFSRKYRSTASTGSFQTTKTGSTPYRS